MTRHILKITAAVQTCKQRFATVTIVNEYQALKEIDGGQIIIATAKKYGVAKITVLQWFKKKAEIFEPAEGKIVSKKWK